ncbi:hypothetical protein PROFUN_11055 [Planoprotostelium fungivorum]|uniref:Uncharacterized protein n=1 Tax=Planoprotostelium fungivorum TaxID=1890364 RepID=A0A2P6NBQ4_9EUKA|nr:hypothetical protein PROFUN_11055 [Planoprotostelium fungivorum]
MGNTHGLNSRTLTNRASYGNSTLGYPRDNLDLVDRLNFSSAVYRQLQGGLTGLDPTTYYS